MVRQDPAQVNRVFNSALSCSSVKKSAQTSSSSVTPNEHYEQNQGDSSNNIVGVSEYQLGNLFKR